MKLPALFSPALLALLLSQAGLAAAQAPSPTPAPAAAAAPAAPFTSGVDRSTFDTAVRPQDDLYRAANGRWLSDTPIPPDKSAFGVWDVLVDRANERVHTIVEELAAGTHPAGSAEQKVADFYRSFMDKAGIDKAGLAPLAPWLAQIDAVKTPTELAALFGRLQGTVDTPVVAWVDADPKEPTLNRAALYQSGLGLPDRDYYLKPDKRLAQARSAYLAYLETLFGLSGDPRAAAHARTVLALELKLARIQWSSVANRDAVKTYNPMTPQALAKATPGLDWPAFFAAAALPGIDRLSVSQPSYVKALAALAARTPLADWRLYLRARLLDDHANVLPQAFREAHFELHGKTLSGQQKPKPRWEQAIAALDTALGEAVGQVYAARHFPPANKARMQTLVANLLAAYGSSIDGVKWMSAKTRERAKQKLAKYTVKIGYPDRWRDYTALQVRAGDPLGNAARAGRFEHERRAVRNGQPVDRAEWGMTPQTVNAYYNPSFNEIVFPAAILEPPFFDMGADDAANYGATGATIGHEISHGFDDEGSQYDGDGKLDNWWTAADRKAFDRLTAQLVAQYDAYQPLPGRKLNGKLTLGENIADLSGLEIAYKAWQLTLGGKPSPVIDGLTGDQRFFYAYAQSWRENVREARSLQLLTMDPHAPSEFRANGSSINIDAFHQTFGTQPGDKLYKPTAKRIRIW
ncbi:MAG TPA: M13 family metallopeptidase [Ideonella sp.]|nr:M13 family metallopeptidase [Ideonella sp.]